MPTALNQKVAHLIRDFRAVHQLAELIEHELEKRIVARLGLIKIEALQSILGAYKNDIKRSNATAPRATVQDLEDQIRQLTKDVETGIRDARNANVGHSLALPVERIPEHWLFMGRSSFSILEQDLKDIETLLSRLDSAYSPIALPPFDPAIIRTWSEPSGLGPKGVVRGAFIYAGPWTPDIISVFPGNTPFQDASIRVLGLRLMLRQIGLLMRPFWLEGGPVTVWERLLLELAMIDFFSLEEA